MNAGIYELIDSGLEQRLRFDCISNNLANLSTHGFKKDDISFQEILGMEVHTKTDFSPGEIIHTGNPLDVALEGKGFFKIQTPMGDRYTKNGSFSLNAEQQLMTRSGALVLGEQGPIKINGKDMSIEPDGTVKVDGSPAGRLLIMTFERPEFLKKEGHSQYQYLGKEEEVSPSSAFSVKQGCVEGSNVNPTEEMIKLIQVNREFEAAQKGIQSLDDVTSKLVNDQGLIS